MDSLYVKIKYITEALLVECTTSAAAVTFSYKSRYMMVEEHDIKYVEDWDKFLDVNGKYVNTRYQLGLKIWQG